MSEKKSSKPNLYSNMCIPLRHFFGVKFSTLLDERVSPGYSEDRGLRLLMPLTQILSPQ